MTSRASEACCSHPPAGPAVAGSFHLMNWMLSRETEGEVALEGSLQMEPSGKAELKPS